MDCVSFKIDNRILLILKVSIWKTFCGTLQNVVSRSLGMEKFQQTTGFGTFFDQLFCEHSQRPAPPSHLFASVLTW